MPEYLTDRPDPSRPMTRAALELDARASHAMLHALIAQRGGYRLRAETAEERRAEALGEMGIRKT